MKAKLVPNAFHYYKTSHFHLNEEYVVCFGAVSGIAGCKSLTNESSISKNIYRLEEEEEEE
jgi:hypothetical protein